MQNIFDLTGKIALITGSARGLGFTFAKGYVQAGARVVLNDVSQEELDKAIATLKEMGGEAFGYCFDVTDQEAVEKCVAEIEAKIGPIDILINNAGIQRRAPLDEMTADTFRKVVDVNLTSAFIVGQSVAKRMITRKRGKIINITSLNAVMARPNIGNYCAAKGGLTMLTKSMATEWGRHNITTNAIGPGYFKTELTRILVEVRFLTHGSKAKCHSADGVTLWTWSAQPFS
jgi:gluconate 5-dehydrogenase